MTNFELVREFHNKFDIPSPVSPQIPSGARVSLREDLIREEVEELEDAIARGAIVAIADALADLLYVTYGAALEFGLPIDRVFAEVHRSNMTKLGPGGKPIKRSDGKILKPLTYEPPDIAGVL